MIDPITAILAAIIIFLALVLTIAAINVWRLRRFGSYGPTPDAELPMVSILVPARNEERSIKRCIQSLAAQNYPHFEVLILDDHSTDGTAGLLAELEKAHPQVWVYQGAALPEGWLGKHWACHQLAQKADGTLLLFTDADTEHHPMMLRDAVSALRGEQADLLSAMPKQQVVSWGERLVIPVLGWSILTFLPLPIAYAIRWSAICAAVGQFMLFQCEAYEQIGGFGAVRGEVIDDFALAKRIKQAGLRWRLADATNRVECRMYHSFDEVIEGLSKNLFAVSGGNLLVHGWIWGWVAIVFLLPLILVAGGVIGGMALLNWLLCGIAIAGGLALWVLSNHKFGFGVLASRWYPVTVAITVWIAARSVLMTLRGANQWKGRALSVSQQAAD